MPDWTKSMQQTYEYYIVDPTTWKDSKPINTVKSCTIDRDAEVETLGSATFELTEPIGECYVRVYLVTIQNGVREKHPLGTFLVQTPSTKFDGKVQTISADAYTPLLELKDDSPDLGYYIPKKTNVMAMAYQLTRDNVRAPVIKTEHSATNFYDFIADTDDTWLSFLTDFITNHSNEGESSTSYEYALDELGRIYFSPKQNVSSLQPVWTYDDGNSSILRPEITINRDIYAIPNVVEVIYSNGSINRHVIAINNDRNSPTSIVNRGRRIIYRDSEPTIVGNPSLLQVKEYAKQRLRDLSALECELSYVHGYCPVRLRDCVRLNYSKAGIVDVKAKVMAQSIKCETGCLVTEKAVYTTNSSPNVTFL